MDWAHFDKLEDQIHRLTEQLQALEAEAATLRAEHQRLQEAARGEEAAVRSLQKANAALSEQMEHASQNGEFNKEIQLCLVRVLRKLEELQHTL